MNLDPKLYKLSPKQKRGMVFQTKELADMRVSELKIYGRKAIRKGRTVFEIFE